MAGFSSLEIALLVLEYLIEVKCFDAATLFQNTSSDLREQIQQHMSSPTLFDNIPTVNSISLAGVLKKRLQLQNTDSPTEKQPRQKRLTKDQKAVLNQLFLQKSSLNDKINVASKFGITKAQFQSWNQRMQNIEKKKKNGRIRLLEKQLNDVNSQLDELNQKIQSSTKKKQVSFAASNDPGPSTSRSLFKINENYNSFNSDDSD